MTITKKINQQYIKLKYITHTGIVIVIDFDIFIGMYLLAFILMKMWGGRLISHKMEMTTSKSHTPNLNWERRLWERLHNNHNNNNNNNNVI